jgi:hypothetical protein
MRALQPPFVRLLTNLVSNRATNPDRERNLLLFISGMFLLNGGLNAVMATRGSLRSEHALMAAFLFAAGTFNLYRVRRVPRKREPIS